MKTKQILILIAFFVGTLGMYAQTTLTSVIEKRIGDTVYLLDTVSYILKNRANKITDQEISIGGDCIVSLETSPDLRKVWEEHFKPVFSKERAEQLNFRITFRNICDTTGLVRETLIFFRNRENFEKFTLSEIKAMEETVKKHRYKVLSFYRCEGIKYFNGFHPFSPYLLYFEKPK